MKLGTIKQTSAGIVALDWGEIIDWAKHFYKEVHIEMIEHPRHSLRHKRTYTPVIVERCSLLDWELEQLKHLSQEYANECAAANDPQRECPKPIFLDEVSEDVALANANAMADAFKTMFGADTGPQVEAVANT